MSASRIGRLVRAGAECAGSDDWGFMNPGALRVLTSPRSSNVGETPVKPRDTGSPWMRVAPRPEAGGQGVAGSNPVSPTDVMSQDIGDNGPTISQVRWSLTDGSRP